MDVIPAFFDKKKGRYIMYGSTLKQLRMIYGFTAKEFAEKLEISAGYLSEIENEKKQPSLELLNRYSTLLDIKLSTLILITEENESLIGEGKGRLFIRKMMLKLISKSADRSDED